MKHAECLASAETERKKDVAEKRAAAKVLAGEVKAKRVSWLEAAREEREKAERRRQCEALVRGLFLDHTLKATYESPRRWRRLKSRRWRKRSARDERSNPMNSFV